MWTITFALLAVYGVLAGAEDICDKGRGPACFPRDIEPIEFPDSTEALKKICPILITRFSCLVDFKNKCGSDKYPGNMDDGLEQVLELTSDACDEDSELHYELSVSLPCIDRIITGYMNTCQPIIQDAMEAFRSRIHLETGGSDSSEDIQDREKYMCLYEALSFACIEADASVTCGRATKELLGRMMDRVGFLDVVCNADVREEVKAMVEVIQVEFEERIAFNNAVSED